jgi:hypothetical protein
MDTYSINFDYTHELGFETKINFNTQDISLICSAFEIAVMEKNGGCQYLTRDPTENETRCRYEWLINYENDPYGIRISAFFDVSKHNLEKFVFLISWGDNFQNNGKFDDVAQKHVENEINLFLLEVNNIINEKPQDDWTYTFYVNLPMVTVIKTIKRDSITIYPSMKHKMNTENVLAICVHSKGHFGEQVKKETILIFNKLMAILSLLLNFPLKEANMQFSDNFKHERLFNSKNIPLEKVFPIDDYKISPIIPNAIPDISEIVDIAISLMDKLDPKEDDVLWRAINSYIAGISTKTEQPTLSSIAFISSLAAFSKSKSCKGKLNCSKCGELSFQHNLSSEKNEIIENIKNTLKIKEEYNETLNDLVIKVYNKQRSSFVHDAVLRHAEAEKDVFSLTVYRPEKDGSISNEIKFLEDLFTIQGIARQVLLNKLLKYDTRIQNILDNDIDYLKNRDSSRVRAIANLKHNASLKMGHPLYNQ